MPVYHQHSEIEMNFVEKGMITYLFGHQSVSIKEGQLAVFWAAVPHRLTQFESDTTLHWLTVPITTFLQWNLSSEMTTKILHGEFVLEPALEGLTYDDALFTQWHQDLKENTLEKRQIVLFEIEARTRRLALSSSSVLFKRHSAEDDKTDANEVNLSKAERMALFVAQNFMHPISVSDVASFVDLHPNYAMQLFQATFGTTILNHMMQHRVWHAQCLLVTTNRDVIDIALESGFNSVSRFYVAFKRICGATPRDYRFSVLQATTLRSFS